jgi:hypothetical protein
MTPALLDQLKGELMGIGSAEQRAAAPAQTASDARAPRRCAAAPPPPPTPNTALPK